MCAILQHPHMPCWVGPSPTNIPRKERVNYATRTNVVNLILAPVIAVVLTLLHKYVSSLFEIWHIYL